MNAVNSLYETDFVAWTQQQADALRTRRLDRLDYDNLIEEIESMGRQQRAELVNRLSVLLAHLLKWEHQSAARRLHARSWRLRIREQRDQVDELVGDNPSLKPFFEEAMARAYRRAVLIASRESGLAGEDSMACVRTPSIKRPRATGCLSEKGRSGRASAEAHADRV